MKGNLYIPSYSIATTTSDPYLDITHPLKILVFIINTLEGKVIIHLTNPSHWIGSIKLS